MTTTSIPNLSQTGQTGNGVLSTRSASYGDNPFLRLLTEQLRSQTPFEPVDNESFMNQMASYSSMQQQQELNTNMLQLLDYQGVLARLQGLSEGSSLLGKQISFTDDAGRESTDVVNSVYVGQDGQVRVRTEGGRDMELRKVTGVASPPSAA